MLGVLSIALLLQCSLAVAEHHNSVNGILERIEDYADTLGKNKNFVWRALYLIEPYLDGH